MSDSKIELLDLWSLPLVAVKVELEIIQKIASSVFQASVNNPGDQFSARFLYSLAALKLSEFEEQDRQDEINYRDAIKLENDIEFGLPPLDEEDNKDDHNSD